jgi:hypothetical protein
MINVTIPEDSTVLLMLHLLSKEYQYFMRAQIGKDFLPTFYELESKMLNKEIQVKMDAEKEAAGEALYVKKGQT